MSGHQIGGECANKLVTAYADNVDAYDSLVLMGSYVDDQNVYDYKSPVFTMGAELDGGMGRPVYLYHSIVSSDSWARVNGGVD